LETFTKAYKISQNSALFWNNLAILMAKKNKDIAAYCCFKKALFLDPFRYDIHANLGMILMKVKK
jgi:Flp pilus assembly protein TadD